MATNSLATDARWELVTRITESSQFQKCSRLREFLLYACECALQDRAGHLHEQQIGTKVFGRPPEYNTNEDNIVRVSARQLRKRLEEYFAGEGREEPVKIIIPKGSYVPVFEPRTTESPAPAPSVERVSGAIQETYKLRWQYFAWIQPVLLVGLTLACYFLWARTHAQLAAAKAPPNNASTPNALWAALFNNEADTTIVCADSTLVLLQDLTRQPVTLADYLSRNYFSNMEQVSRKESISRLFTKQYTSMADVRIVEQLVQLSEPHWARNVVRSARNMQLRDFNRGNFILIGSKRAIPWVELFESRLNFRFKFNEGASTIRNMTPRPGEQDEYVNSPAGQPGDAYSSVAFVPNLSYNGHVLIISGTTMEATEAAGEFLTNPAYASKLFSVVSSKANSKLGPFEILLKSNTLAGSSRNSELVAYRSQPD